MKVKTLNKIKKGLWLLAALGWWGVLFPELSLTRDVCRVVRSDDMQPEEELSQTEIYYRLLSAEPEQIKIKSRLLEILAAYFEKDKGR